MHYMHSEVILHVPLPNGKLGKLVIEVVYAAFQHLLQLEYGHVYLHTALMMANTTYRY
jgi:hypothetical protein